MSMSTLNLARRIVIRHPRGSPVYQHLHHPCRAFGTTQSVATIKESLDGIKESLRGARAEVKDLSSRMDRSFDRLENKIDHLLYFFLGGLVLKGGFDLYMNEKNERTRIA